MESMASTFFMQDPSRTGNYLHLLLCSKLHLSELRKNLQELEPGQW